MYKFAIIGCGETGSGHIRQIQQHGDIIAVCDTIQERADAFAQQYQAKAYYYIDDMLASEKSVDIIVICTPTGMHAEHCIKSAQAGLHVLCETPLCITGVAAWQIMETFRYCDRKLFGVDANRYSPSLLSFKRSLEKENAGRLYSFQLNCSCQRPTTWYDDPWRGKLFPAGGLLYSEFSPYIDSLVWLVGEIKSVSGFRKNMTHESLLEFEDTGIASIEMQNGMIGSLSWSVNVHPQERESTLTIFTEKGMMRIDGEQLRDLAAPALVNGYAGVYEDMVKSIQDNSYSNSYEGLKTVEAIERIYKAVQQS